MPAMTSTQQPHSNSDGRRRCTTVSHNGTDNTVNCVRNADTEEGVCPSAAI